ncbi:LamG domain-containing protein [Candidatus Nanosalina sp. VS9-1]|uniref:LamG domain-containing protein n=1 Tax=Candidatus Nanosalina sp. VS9-1 TaxID=3388566 RepID=UPI0039E0169B
MTLVGYWPLNENSGTTAYDHSGNENHGTVNGDVSPGSPGILNGYSYSFDGSGDYVNASDRSYLRPQRFTVTAWFKTSGITGWSAIYGKEYWNNNEGWVIYMGAQGNGYIHFNGPQFSTLSTSQQYDDGNWHHLTVTYDNSTAKIYIDGSQKTEGNRSFNNSTISLNIGSRHSNDGTTSGNDSWNGQLTEARIYNRPLTEREIQYLYNVGKRGLQTTSKKSS